MEFQVAPENANDARPAFTLKAPLGGFCHVCLLPTLLSILAGSTDVISFLGLGLFNAHITGNLVILAAHTVTRGQADLALMLSVPVFIAVLCFMRLLVARLEALPINSLVLLLLVQLVLVAGFFILCGVPDSPLDPTATRALIGAQFGVAAMAVQAALVELSLQGAPATTSMTTNITRLIMDAGEVLFGGSSAKALHARWRLKYMWPVIAGFAFGASLGAWCYAEAGLKSLALPAVLALLGLITGLSIKDTPRAKTEHSIILKKLETPSKSPEAFHPDRTR